MPTLQIGRTIRKGFMFSFFSIEEDKKCEELEIDDPKIVNGKLMLTPRILRTRNFAFPGLIGNNFARTKFISLNLKLPSKSNNIQFYSIIATDQSTNFPVSFSIQSVHDKLQIATNNTLATHSKSISLDYDLNSYHVYSFEFNQFNISLHIDGNQEYTWTLPRNFEENEITLSFGIKTNDKYSMLKPQEWNCYAWLVDFIRVHQEPLNLQDINFGM